MVRQDGEAVLRKRRAQDVAQKACAAVVIDGSCVGLGVQVETAVLHHEQWTLPTVLLSSSGQAFPVIN